MNLVSVIRSLRDASKYYGPAAALYDAEYRGLNHVVPVKALRGMALDFAHAPPALSVPEGLSSRFCTAGELLAARSNPELAAEFDAGFVHRAFDRGDACRGVFDGDRLVSFSWYSNQPTPCSEDLVIHVDPAWIYLYKAYTLESHRGRRLNALGVSLAASELERRGRGLVCYIEANNYASLHSFEGIGFSSFGTTYIARVMGRPFIWATPGCKPYGFFVEWAPHVERAIA